MTRVDTVLDQALQQPPDEAERFVAVACGDDAALQARVLRLLRLARSTHVDDALGHLLGGATALALASIAPPGPARVGAWRERLTDSAAKRQAALRAIAEGRDSGYQPSA